MFPRLTDIEKEIFENILTKKRDNLESSKLIPWVRVISGAVVNGQLGLVMTSNPELELFSQAGFGSLYGSTDSVGSLGVDLTGKPVGGGSDRGLRPSPIITDFQVSEGKDQISREATLSLTCYSLAQLEHIQDYFLEPGYSLCVEWGWNTPEAAIRITSGKDGNGTQLTPESFIASIADRNLDYDKLHTLRKGSKGDYDCFLGFIVGGSVSTEGEQYNVSVKLRGAPGLPTFLQSHTRINEKSATDNKIIDGQNTTLFQTSEMNETEPNSAERRWRRTFNELPAPRQIKNVKGLSGKNTYTNLDFVNLDDVITKNLQTFAHPSFWTFGPAGSQNFTVDGVEISKERLLSKNRYIRFKVAMDILNENGALDAYVVGGKKISVKIVTKDTRIGAFPHMFSTKSSALLIPGPIPDFSPYFLNASAKIHGGPDGYIYVDGTPIPPLTIEAGSIGGRSFVQNDALNGDGFKENKGYWGFIEDLYINLEMFNSKISQTNKNVREILIDILNEMTSAVNLFWNFQIVEKQIDNTIVITIYDENWIGTKPSDEDRKFYHTGTYSPFLESNLDLSLPGEMVNQIVCNRLRLATQPGAPPLSTSGSFFNSENDLFLNKVVVNGNEKSYKKLGLNEGNNGENTGQPEPPKKSKSELTQEAIDKKNTTITGLKTDLAKLEAEVKKVNDEIAKIDDIVYNAEQRAERERLIKINDGNRANVKAKQKEIDDTQTEITNLTTQKDEELRQEVKDAEDAKKAAVNQNIAKIDIVPAPFWTNSLTIGTDVTQKADVFNYLFRIYCYDDTAYFDLLRKNAFEENGALSHPLPIKYTFKILGSSGIRRGDTFNIIGIPQKYADFGLFQVTKIDHILSNMEWTTTITGEYRQKQGSIGGAPSGEKQPPEKNQAEIDEAAKRKKLESGEILGNPNDGYITPIM